MSPPQQYAQYHWAKVKFETLEKGVEEARADAAACRQEHTIEELKMGIQRWTRWWMGITITLLGALVSIAVMAWSAAERVTRMENGLDNVGSKIVEVSDTVDRVVTAQHELKTSLDVPTEVTTDDIDEIKRALKELTKMKGKRK